jgi:hypothetical protein
MSITRRIKEKFHIEAEASDAPGICILGPGILGGQRPVDFADYSRLAVKDNLILLISDGRLGNKPSRLTLGRPRNSQQRAAAYSRAATERAGSSVDQILALAKNAEGLFAAIACAEITGAPLALILVDEQPFLNDRSADPSNVRYIPLDRGPTSRLHKGSVTDK